MGSIISNKEILENVVSGSFYKKEVLNKLGYKTLSGNYKTLDKYLSLYKIDISHFLKAKDSIKGKAFNKKYELDEILVKDFKGALSNTVIKGYLYKEGLKEEKCEMCSQPTNWFGKNLSFILDHINGDNNDNRIENIRIICPNCDSTLKTYMGRNNINPQSKRQKNIRLRINKGLNKNLELEHIKQILLESNIDFTKKTWGKVVSKLLNKSPQYCLKFIKKNFKEFLIN